MKVSFYFGVFARYGGIEEFTNDLALSLSAAGLDVQIICASMKNPILDNLKTKGVKVIRVPVFWGCRWNIPDYALLPFALWSMKKSDVVIHQKPFKLSFYRLLSRKAKHIYITAYRPTEQFPDPEYRKNFFSLFDLVLTQTRLFKEELKEVADASFVKSIPYIPPIPFGQSDKRSTDGILKIGMMGRLEAQKNPGFAMKIVADLQRNLPGCWHKIEFHVYGSGSLESMMRTESANIGLTTVFHGKYDRSEVSDIVSENDLFLITSDSEGQCIVALEILAGGRPLFATPIGALPEILNEETRGCIVPQEDSSEAARRISSWLVRNAEIGVADIQRSYIAGFNRKEIELEYVAILKREILSK
ncbi:MAG: glycosyltransferase family 4 protein [Pontiella sp.]